MCLVIKTLPTSQRDSNCVPCQKHYDIHRFRGREVFRTPCQHTVIRDGLLRVFRSTRKRHIDAVVTRQAIHADHKSTSRLSDKKAKAYAFGVMAYGRKDLVCSLLYVPRLDTSVHAAARLKQIEIWLQQPKGPTNSQVRKLFPQFVAP